MGPFDDLMPPEGGATAAAGVFDDLIYAQPSGVPNIPNTPNGGYVPPASRPAPNQPRTGDSLRPLFGGHNPVAQGYDNFLKPWVEGQSPDLEARNASRGILERAGDATAFAASVPVRIFTHGKYGMGDVVGLAAPEIGASISRAEGDFIGANEEYLRAADNAGQVGIGVPALHTMGARPYPGVNHPANGNVGTPTGAHIAAARATQAADDLAAHNRLEVRPLGPSFHEGPVASVGKQVMETPIIGSPLRNAASETLSELAGAVEGGVQRMAGGNTSAHRAGTVLDDALDRYSRSGFERLPEDTVRALPGNIDPMSPVPRQPLMSAGAQRDMQAGNPIRAQQGLPPTIGPGSYTYRPTRTSVEELSDVQLNSVIQAPSFRTSFVAKSEALFERFNRMLPGLMRVDGSANGNLLATPNSGAAIRMVTANIADDISGQSVIMGGIAGRLTNNHSNFQLGDLLRVRTEVGRAIANYDPATQGARLAPGQLRTIYAGLTRDIEIGIETLANRALQRATNGTGGVTMQDALAAVRASREFRRANAYYAAGQRRLESFGRLLRAESPEAAIAQVVRDLTSGEKGNFGRVRGAMMILRPEERNHVAARVLQKLGEPNASARGQVREMDFSPSSFITNLEKMNPELVEMLFGREHGQLLRDVQAVAGRLAEFEALANTSRTATNSINVVATVGALRSAVAGDLITPMVLGGSGLAWATMMSRPQYASWLISYMQVRANVRAGTSAAISPVVLHLRRLAQFAYDNPMLLQVLAIAASENGIDPKEVSP